MSMQGGLGAARAAEEILKLIESRLAEGKTEAQVLLEVMSKAEQIKEDGRSGWY